MEEKDYRIKVNEVFNRISKAFDQVDPDVAEAELSQGSLTILAGKNRTILSPQPSVRQIWLAAAALGIAAHFSWDDQSQKWMDDKGLGREIYAFTREVLEKSTGLLVEI